MKNCVRTASGIRSNGTQYKPKERRISMLNQMTVRAPEELQEELKIRAGKRGTDKKCADPEYFMGLDQKRKGEGEE